MPIRVGLSTAATQNHVTIHYLNITNGAMTYGFWVPISLQDSSLKGGTSFTWVSTT